MNLTPENKPLVALGAAVLLIGGGLGYWFYGNYSSYNEAQQGFDRARAQVNQLESKPLYPNDENVELQRRDVEEFRSAVQALQAGLLEFQPPRRTPTATEFLGRLTGRITSFKDDARAAGVAVPDDFTFDMQAYTTRPPTETIVAEVDWQLDALIHLSELLVSSGVDQITHFKRTPMKAEGGQDDAGETLAYDVYPVEVRFVATQDVFKQVLNSLSHPQSSSYYLLPRVVRIENETVVGPPTGDAITPVPITPDGAAVAPSPQLPDFDFEDAEMEEAQEPGDEDQDAVEEVGGVIEIPVETDSVDAGDDGFNFFESEFFGSAPQPTGFIDARIILGQEKLRIFLRVDLLDFKAPSTGEPPSGEPSVETP